MSDNLDGRDPKFGISIVNFGVLVDSQAQEQNQDRFYSPFHLCVCTGKLFGNKIKNNFSH